jgi:hypothetical protein
MRVKIYGFLQSEEVETATIDLIKSMVFRVEHGSPSWDKLHELNNGQYQQQLPIWRTAGFERDYFVKITTGNLLNGRLDVETLREPMKSWRYKQFELVTEVKKYKFRSRWESNRGQMVEGYRLHLVSARLV